MLKSFHDNKQAISAMLSGELPTSGASSSDEDSSDEGSSGSDEDECEFSKSEWKKIAAVIEILKPVYDATLLVERRDTHAGLIIPLLKSIKFDLLDEPKTELYEDVRRAIVDGLMKRLKGRVNF
jgi:hypothetical protein